MLLLIVLMDSSFQNLETTTTKYTFRKNLLKEIELNQLLYVYLHYNTGSLQLPTLNCSLIPSLITNKMDERNLLSFIQTLIWLPNSINIIELKMPKSLDFMLPRNWELKLSHFWELLNSCISRISIKLLQISDHKLCYTKMASFRTTPFNHPRSARFIT